MMKKLFLFVIGFVMFKMGYSQYPIQQFIGADSAVVTSKGGLQGRLINQVFADTAAANSQRIRQYPGAMIYAGGKMWVRNTTATGWVELAYGPITVNNIYNSDGTLTGNRQLLGNNTYSLEFNQLPTFDLRTNTYTSLRTGNQNITLRGDTAAIFRRLSYNSNISSSFTPYSLVDKNYVDSSILSVPSTNIYNSNGTLTGNRELDGNSNNLTFTAVRKFSLSGDSLDYLLDPSGNLRIGLGNQQFIMRGDTASLSRRLSYTGNLGSSFTKHSLIDKNYVDSVASLAAGTVTSVATNNGTGITGGTITSTGTLAIDTLLISTRAWRQKGIDSVTSLINARPSGSGTTNYLSKWTSSSALGNSLIFDNSTLGNVGINTASPASTLEIFKSTGTNYLYVTNGTSGTLNGVVLRWNSVDYMGMIGNFNSGEFKVGGFNAGGYFMTFYSNNAERMRLTPAGRLLVGTTTESTYLLDVFGTARVQSNSGLSLLVGNTSPVGTATPAVLSLGATFGTTAGSSANVKLRVYDDGGSSTIYGIGISSTLLEIQSNENIGFFNGNSVTRTERMRIFTNGNVGIATNPVDAGYKLDISGTTRISGTELRLDNGTTGTLNIYSATPTINFFSGGGYTFGRSSTTMTWNSGGSISMQIGGNSAYSLDATNGHVWRTATSGGAALARLTTGGNLMVGTTTDVASAILQATSTTKGFLPPRMTNAQMVAIATPASGLMVYDTTNNKLNYYNGTSWVAL